MQTDLTKTLNPTVGDDWTPVVWGLKYRATENTPDGLLIEHADNQGIIGDYEVESPHHAWVCTRDMICEWLLDHYEAEDFYWDLLDCELWDRLTPLVETLMSEPNDKDTIRELKRIFRPSFPGFMNL